MSFSGFPFLGSNRQRFSRQDLSGLAFVSNMAEEIFAKVLGLPSASPLDTEDSVATLACNKPKPSTIRDERKRQQTPKHFPKARQDPPTPTARHTSQIRKLLENF
jgi:hypothetical protein